MSIRKRTVGSESREIRSGQMTVNRLASGVDDVYRFFHGRGLTELRSMYGWACNISISEMWKWSPLPLADLHSFMSRSTANGIFTFGACDLFIADEEDRFTFCFCHEGDLHFQTADLQVLDRIAQNWIGQGFKVYCINKIDPALLRDNSA